MIGIHKAPFSPEIHAGKLNKARTKFTDIPEDVTSMVYRAIADHVMRDFDGSIRITTGEYVMEITVKKTEGDQ